MAFTATDSLLIGILFFVFFSQASANCSNFTAAGHFDEEPGEGAQIISTGLHCQTQLRKDCRIDFAGTVNAQGYSNLSLSERDLLPLYSLVADTFLYSFSSYVNQTQQIAGSGNVGNSTLTVDGYYGFTPLYECINGTLSDCSNGPVADGTGIRICGPLTLQGQPTQLDGLPIFINTDRETAASLRTNPGLSRTAVSTLPKGVKGVVNGAIGRLGDLRTGVWVTCLVVFLFSLLA